MASELRVDTLKDSSGNNSVGMAYVAGGSAKAWINFDGTSTGAVGDYDRDSLNCSVTVDNGTGDYTTGFTSSMDNANYVFGGGTMETGSTGTNDSTVAAHRNTNYSTSVTTSSFTMQVTTSSGSLADRTVFISYTGDLA
jgi:hypothetical protein